MSACCVLRLRPAGTLEQMLAHRLCEAAKKDTIASEAVEDDLAASAPSSSKEVSCSGAEGGHDVNAPSPTETLMKLKVTQHFSLLGERFPM